MIEGKGHTGEVFIDGRKVDVQRSVQLRTHSPGGFAWGYAGSGPAQCALAILLECTTESEALRRYQALKADLLVQVPMPQDFTWPHALVEAWVADRPPEPIDADITQAEGGTMTRPTEQTASHPLRGGLVEKGYRLQARRDVQQDGTVYRQRDYYRKGRQICLLEILTEERSRDEVGCELYLTAVNSNSLAETMAAIP